MKVDTLAGVIFKDKFEESTALYATVRRQKEHTGRVKFLPTRLFSLSKTSVFLCFFCLFVSVSAVNKVILFTNNCHPKHISDFVTLDM